MLRNIDQQIVEAENLAIDAPDDGRTKVPDNEQENTNYFAEAFIKLADRVKQIYKGWGADAAMPGMWGDIPVGLPEIIGECYAASMKMEEGRPTRVRVICADSQIIDALESSKEWDFASFVRKLPLTAHNLRKLAAGLEIPNGAVVVWPEGDKPVIQGLVRVARKRGAGATHEEREHTTRKALSITATAPGALTFDNLERPLCEFENGDFQESIQLFASWSPFRMRRYRFVSSVKVPE